MPQIVLMNHAAWFNGKKMDERSKNNTRRESKIADNGKTVDEMDSTELQNYLKGAL